MPFGGRDLELACLTRWLDDDGQSARLVLVAPAGRGKSALLIHWVRSLEKLGRTGEGDLQWRLIFVPISMRFETNRPEVFYEALAARLAEIVGQEIEPSHVAPAAYYEDQCRVLLDRAIAQNIRTLLVIDGIDEALGERFGAGWFPRNPGPHVRLLVSARLQIGDHNAQGWIARLGWSDGVRVQPFELPTLSPHGIGELLGSEGGSSVLSRLARRLHADFLSSPRVSLCY